MYKNNLNKVLKNWILPVFIALFFAFVIQTLFIKSFKYSGGFMEPTICDGDFIYVSKTKNIKIDDIVLVNNPLEENSDNFYLKRCVAVSGDTLEICNGSLYINNQEFISKGNIKNNYRIFAFDSISEYVVTEGFYSQNNITVTGMYNIAIDNNQLEKVAEDAILKNVKKNYLPKGYSKSSIFPYSFRYRWNGDNFGPLIIPQKGQTVFLNAQSLPLYKQIISVYEDNNFREENGVFYINEKQTQFYTFKQNYIFLLNDNRLDLSDSRTWGLIPEEKIKGKALFIWFSTNSINRFFQKL